jgi:hypothetical protein
MPHERASLRRIHHRVDLIMTEIIRAELTGSNTCAAKGITVRANAPVLGLCRKLIDAGHDPDSPLHCYRGDVLCLKIRSIGEGAKLAVREDARRGPDLVRWRPFPVTRGEAGIAPNDGEAITPLAEAAE